jgi:diadenosine tetraphosphate (Ap4A) HIT family hydrolase
MTKPCPFCTLPATAKVSQNALAFWVYDIAPSARGHSLIIPKRHVASFFDLTMEERQAMLALVDEARDAIARAHGPDGYNVGLNDGEAAGQTVAHVHLRLIPRHVGDVADPRGGIRWVLPETADYWSPR